MGISSPRREYAASPGRAVIELGVFGLALAAWVLANVDAGYFIEGPILWIYGAMAAYVILHLAIYRGMTARWGFDRRGLGSGCIVVPLYGAPMLLSGMVLSSGLDLPKFPLHPGMYLAWCVVQAPFFLDAALPPHYLIVRQLSATQTVRFVLG